MTQTPQASTADAAPDADSPDISDAERAAREFEALPVPQQRAAVFRTQAGRETAEAFAVAFILALLFRAFIAEVFVIPTGSMAPALMGAHKDLFCQQCGQSFPVGASTENRDTITTEVVVGGVCPNCRFLNPLDLVNNSQHTTFTGDRILVSKFAYMVRDPQRWDVIVFKVPVNPKQNYIKRLVGLPGETITVHHGDVFAKPTVDDDDASRPMVGGEVELGQVLRKDPATMLAMSHFVYDSDRQSELLVAANFPARLQPWSPGLTTRPDDSWQVEQSVETGLRARLPADSTGKSPAWLRYFHRYPTGEQWSKANDGLSLAGVDPYESRLITDFHAYDAYALVQSFLVYNESPRSDGVSLLGRLMGQSRTEGQFRPDYKSGEDLSQFRGNYRIGGTGLAADGVNWVGDLIVEADLETDSAATTAMVETIEAGIKYRCVIDLSDGTARFVILDGREGRETPIPIDVGVDSVAKTPIRAGSRHSIRWSNCDGEFTLWVDDKVMPFAGPTQFDPAEFTTASQDRPYFNGVGDPLDASPVGVAVAGGGATVHRLRIDRDKYYIATNSEQSGIIDYDLADMARRTGGSVRLNEIQQLMAAPEVWDRFDGWRSRRTVSFPLGEGQFFPMGDNSPESLDARCWAGTKSRDRALPPSPDGDAYLFGDAAYVPRDLLVGKALMVFWPHPWNSPLPLTPNFKRIQLIR